MAPGQTTSANSDHNRAAAWLQSPSVDVWLKFLLALVGLAIAFGAALLSTASGEAGNPLASVILASLALLMAALVGLVTVPYLARRVALERLRESLRFEVTKAGIIYVLATLVIGIAALNTGNNLLYIVVAAMLGAILVSGVGSAVVLRRLELDVRLPEHVFADRPVVGRILLRNPRRLLSAFSIQIVPANKGRKIAAQTKWRFERTTFAFPLNRPPERQWVRMRDWKVKRIQATFPEPGIFEGAVYFPYLPAKSESLAELQLRFDHRGRYRESSFGMATRFPFSFLTKTRDIGLEREVIVYPSVDRMHELSEILPQLQGEWPTYMRGRGSDLYLIREYMPEDSARHVDWKATAKSGSLKVREFSREDDRKVCIVFDNPAVGLISESVYERAVNLAASLGWHLASQNAELSFLITGRRRTADVYDFLKELALIQPEQDPQSAPIGPELLASGEYNVIITARTRQNLPHELSHSQFICLDELQS